MTERFTEKESVREGRMVIAEEREEKMVLQGPRQPYLSQNTIISV